MSIIIHPKIIKMQNELNKFVFEYEELVNQICPNIENQYLTNFGMFEYELYSKELKLNKLKMKLRLIQIEINHQRKIDWDDIDKKVNDKFKSHLDRLNKYMDECIEAIDNNQHSKTLSGEETITIKEIYRIIVKKTHPDLNKNLNKHEKDIFILATNAFKNGNLIELESLLFALSDSNEDICNDFDKLKELIDEFKSRINKIKNDYPYNKIDILSDRISVFSNTYHVL